MDRIRINSSLHAKELVGAEIAKYRTRNGMTQEEFAESLKGFNIRQYHISRIEKGKHHIYQPLFSILEVTDMSDDEKQKALVNNLIEDLNLN